MATINQEEIYKDIVEYYKFAERLIAATQDSQHKLASEQFAIIETVISQLESCVDQLSTQYIEYVKTGESEKITESVRSSFNEISGKIEECRNKILMLHQKNFS